MILKLVDDNSGIRGSNISTIFKQNKITKNDSAVFSNIASQISSGIKPAQALTENLDKLSASSQILAKTTAESGGSFTQLATDMNTATLASKAASIGMGLLNAAMNIGIGLIISGVIAGLDYLIHRTEITLV